MTGVLYIVPTPIGNLEDMTLRALSTLKSADLILAEDTRTTSVLLKHFEISRPLRAYHQHNEHKTVAGLVEMLEGGASIALVSDAGTPGISDPGFLLVREAVKQNVKIVTLPGATAFVPALVNSGLPCSEFAFYGFLPQKKGRRTKIESLATEEKTFVLYESPFRLPKLLQELAEALGGDRQASVSREISKMFEETVRGSLGMLRDSYAEKQVKGEIVVVVEGSNKKKPADE